MQEKKKILFYALLESGHFNVCISIGKAILREHEDKVDIYFIVNGFWEERIRKIDERFKLVKIDSKDSGIIEMAKKFKEFLGIPQIERIFEFSNIFLQDKTANEIDKLTEKKLKEIKPDFILCDQLNHLPSVQSFEYGFIISSNPLQFRLDGLPYYLEGVGSMNEEQIKELNTKLKDIEIKFAEKLENNFKERGVEIPKVPLSLTKPISKHFTIYTYPSELEYYNDEIRESYRLWQIDGPLLPERIPKPFELPEDFKKLPGKIIYFSLGSIYSIYVDHLQKMINMLDKVPNCKFIISKGPRGDELKFPSNKFIGENYINQLAVLQVCDLMISHGGNNTFCECFYMGVIQIIAGVLGDQINNSKRIEETGYGYTINLLKYTEEELLSTIEKALDDEELREKLKKISQRIQKENRIYQIGNKIVDYVDKLKKQKI